MILLREMIRDAGLSVDEFTARTGCKRQTIYPYFNGLPPKRKLKIRVESVVLSMPELSRQLDGKEVSAVWDQVEDKRGRLPADQGDRVRKGNKSHAGLAIGDPLELKTRKEIVMITGRALKHFKMIRNPFVNEITDPRDIFMGEEHRFVKEMMLDAARYGGFVAISGEVGCGKSVMRKAVSQELVNEGIRIIYPVIIDKARVTPNSLIDAIIMDISEQTPRRALEQKTRQALTLLRNRAASGMKQVLIIEEAHVLSTGAMKALKQIYELEQGFNRLVGIILIGQPELKMVLDETQNQDMREVIRRITKAEIAGLKGEIGRYIEHKFKRVNRGLSDVFADGAIEAMDTRLMGFAGAQRKVSMSYPLSVNNLTARAMNLTVDMGEERVTAEIVMTC